MRSTVQRLLVWTLTGVLITATLPIGMDTAVAQSNPGFEIQYDESGAGAGGGGGIFTEDFQVRTTEDGDTIELGPEAYEIRVVKTATNEQVTLSFENASQAYRASEIEVDPGKISTGSTTFVVTLTGSDLEEGFVYPNVTLEGDTGMFEGKTFAEYEIQIVDQDGNAVATTAPAIHAFEYETSVQYNGSAIAVTRDEEVDSDWYVELAQDLDDEPLDETVLEFENKAGTDYFVASVQGTEFIQDKEFAVNIYAEEDDRLGERYAHLYGFTLSEAEQVDGPVGNRTQSDETAARFDTNGQPGIQRDEVVTGIVEFNSDGTIGGEPVTRGDIVELIVQFNS